jgi:hypothetical protein
VSLFSICAFSLKRRFRACTAIDHIALGNETEAGLTLKLHADLHEWDLSKYVEAVPDLDLPRQTEFARKE